MSDEMARAIPGGRERIPVSGRAADCGQPAAASIQAASAARAVQSTVRGQLLRTNAATVSWA